MLKGRLLAGNGPLPYCSREKPSNETLRLLEITGTAARRQNDRRHQCWTDLPRVERTSAQRCESTASEFGLVRRRRTWRCRFAAAPAGGDARRRRQFVAESGVLGCPGEPEFEQRSAHCVGQRIL